MFLFSLGCVESSDMQFCPAFGGVAPMMTENEEQVENWRSALMQIQLPLRSALIGHIRCTVAAYWLQ